MMKLRELLRNITSDNMEVFTTDEHYIALSYGDDKNVHDELIQTMFINWKVKHIIHDSTKNALVVYIEE